MDQTTCPEAWGFQVGIPKNLIHSIYVYFLRIEIESQNKSFHKLYKSKTMRV